MGGWDPGVRRWRSYPGDHGDGGKARVHGTNGDRESFEVSRVVAGGDRHRLIGGGAETRGRRIGFSFGFGILGCDRFAAAMTVTLGRAAAARRRSRSRFRSAAGRSRRSEYRNLPRENQEDVKRRPYHIATIV